MQSQKIIGNSAESLIQFYSSPDTSDIRPVSFPFWMVREIALDLEEKSHLEAQQELLEQEIGTYNLLVLGLEKEKRNLVLQLELLGRNQQLLLSQLEATRKGKPEKPIKWILRLIAALGTGFILGSLNP